MTEPIIKESDGGESRREPCELYFWLGEEAEEVTKEEFIKKQEELRKAKDDFVNVNWPS